MRSIYFFLPEYPEWTTGGHKYHTILFEYFKKKRSGIFSFGHNRFTKSVETNKFLKIVFGIYYTIKIPRKSIIIQSNTSFLHCFIPVVLNTLWKHHYYFLIVHHLVRDEKPSYLRMKLEDYFIKKANKVVTVSSTTKKKLYDLNLGLRGIEIFSPGLDVNVQKYNYEKTFPEKLKMLFVGSLEERKGLIYLIEATSILSSSNFELNIIGEESNSREYYDLLQQKIKVLKLEGKVLFRGKVNKDDLKEYYSNSSIFVFPSLWEGYGMVVAEAMAYGLPVIASRIPAIEELIDDGKNGLLVETKNVGQIAEKINLLFTNELLKKKLSEAGLMKARSFTIWEDTCKRIMNSINMDE